MTYSSINRIPEIAIGAIGLILTGYFGYGVWLTNQPRPQKLNEMGNDLRSIQPPQAIAPALRAGAQRQAIDPQPIPQAMPPASPQPQNPVIVPDRSSPAVQPQGANGLPATRAPQRDAIVQGCASEIFRFHAAEARFYYGDFAPVPCPGWQQEFPQFVR